MSITILIPFVLLGGEKPDAAVAAPPIALRVGPPLKKMAPKAAGKTVVIVALGDQKNPPEKWRVLGEIRDQIERCLEKEGVKASIAPKIEEFLAARAQEKVQRPFGLAQILELCPADLVLQASYLRRRQSRSVAFSLIDAKAKRELWKGAAELRESDVGIAKHVPALNLKVVEFARSKKGTQVGNGECWTLVADALQAAGAKRDGIYGFGRELGPRDPIYPGDLMQFEKAEFQGAHNATMPHHSAIVEEVQGETLLQLISQNFGSAGKTVSLTVIDLRERKGGTITIFRPRASDESK